MGEATKVLRSSINAFLHSYHSFTSIAALLIFPVSALTLLSQAAIASSPRALEFITYRIRAIFHAASFPSSSLLTLSLSQTVFSSAISLPFTLTLLVLAKAAVIRTASARSPPPLSSLLRLYPSLLLTHLFNFFLLLAANAAIFSLLFLLFASADLLGQSSRLAVSSVGAVLYSVAIAKTVVTCNLAVVVSAAEDRCGYAAVLRACVLIRGRVGTALSLALAANLALAAVEALFQYRVVRRYGKFDVSMVSEAFTIAYVHSILIVLDIVANFLFYKSCKSGCSEDWEDIGIGYHEGLEPEDKCAV